MTPAIAIDGVEKTYVSRGRETLALARVDLDIAPGEFVAFVGPSGCGKSTLLNMIAGIVPISSGQIRQNDRAITSINQQVGYLTQMDSVLPWKTVEDNVALPLKFHRMSAGEQRKRIDEMLEMVDLKGFSRSFPKELSGGMRKRVALAQMLAYRPQTLLMDEPFGALDAQLKLTMQDHLLRIWQDQKLTVVFVTHDLTEAIALASRVIVFSGRPGSIIHEEKIDIPYPRDVFQVRFRPEFEQAYNTLWDKLAPEIRKGEEL